MSHPTRRGFLKDTVMYGAVASLVPATAKRPAAQAAASRDRVAGANRRVRVGLIGCGGMGMSNLRAMLRAGTQCVALCDVDNEQLVKAQQAIDTEFGQTPTMSTQDFRHVLDRKDVDAVIVGTPDHWHALQTVMACEAGKDVYVEKPLSLTIGEGRVMVDVARRHNRVVQMGTQQRSAPHFADAIEHVKSGALGKIRLVKTWAYQDWMGNIPKLPDEAPPPAVNYDLWLGPAPERPFNRNRFHFNFRWFWDYSGGLMTDWGAHMIDIANWGMDVRAPRAAVSLGGKFGFPESAEETPDTQQALWELDGFSMIWEHATAIGQGPYMRDHGVAFHGNDGVLVVDRGGWEVFPETETKERRKTYRAAGVPRRGSGNRDYHQLHVENFLACMDSRGRPRSDVEIGHNSMIACHLANIAFRLRRRVNWDVDNERVTDDTEAQAMVTKRYRSPWSLDSYARGRSAASVGAA